MTISVVQYNSVAFNGSLSATPSLTGVGSGHALILLNSHVDLGGGTPTFTYFTSGVTWTQDSAANSTGGACGASIASTLNVGGGSYSASVTANSGTAANSEGTATLVEVSGLFTSSALDQQVAVGGNSTTPATGNTSALAQQSEIIFAIMTFGSSFTGLTFPPTGGPGTYTQIAHSGATYTDQNYQIDSSSTAAVSATWGTAGASGKWAVALATYKGAVSAGIIPVGMMMGVGA